VPIVSVIAMSPASASLAGQAAVVLAGVAGVVLVVAVALRPARRAESLASRRAGRVATWARTLASLRDGLGRRTHPAVAAAVALAAGLAVSVAVSYAAGLLTKAGVVVRLDRPVDRFVDGHRLAAVVHLMLTGTLLGSYPVVYSIAAVTGLIVGAIVRRWLPLIVAVAAVPTEIVIQKLLSGLVHGTKPAQALAIGSPGGYFSGGSARTLIACGLLAYFAGWTGLARERRVLLWAVAAIASFAEGYSRLYLGRHWAVDIVGGWLLGALVLASIIFAVEALRPAADEKAGAHGAQPGASVLPAARALEGALVSQIGTESGR
jgi:membrane-associated phospholipid phosphatase